MQKIKILGEESDAEDEPGEENKPDEAPDLSDSEDEKENEKENAIVTETFDDPKFRERNAYVLLLNIEAYNRYSVTVLTKKLNKIF